MIYPASLWKYDISDPTLVDVTNNCFVLCTNMKVYLYNFYSVCVCVCVCVCVFGGGGGGSITIHEGNSQRLHYSKITYMQSTIGDKIILRK